MPECSVLFENLDEISSLELAEMPEFFQDLNLDQVIDAITSRKSEYKLNSFFYSPLKKIDEIEFRQTVFRDLENKEVFRIVKAFAEKMIIFRRYINFIKKLEYKYHKEGWFLEAAGVYCEAVSLLDKEIQAVQVKSKGLGDFKAFLNRYATSEPFLILQTDTHNRKTELNSAKYNVMIRGNWVRVRKYESEIDYSKEVERTFEKFKQGEVKNHRVDLIVTSGMNHVEAQIINLVAKLYPEIFLELDSFCVNHNNFPDQTILAFDREIQFYISFIEFMENIKLLGLEFCFPKIVVNEKKIHATESFDISLANKLMYEKTPIVCNDFYMEGKERIFVVSGPNQGGKTTFARMFGQLHYLASLGCPIPGKDAQLFLFDRIFTHFEVEEDIRNLRGKLMDDLVRIQKDLKQATTNSIFLINEIFTSTSLQDAIFLSKEILGRIIQLDALCVCVTFIDELSTLDVQTVSMVSTVVAEDPSLRTFKIIRKPADGLSYAISIAEKHHLTYQLIKERIIS